MRRKGLISMEGTLAAQLVHLVNGFTFETLPKPVLEKTKDLLLDTIGICLSSATMDFGIGISKLAGSWGGLSESSLIGSRSKVPAHHAAFANGVLAHGQDFDDTHTEAVVHPSACLVPVSLAIGEKRASSSREIITALAAGLELMIRIGLPAPNQFHVGGFHTSSISGTFASSLVTARLMGLDEKKMADALGICGSFASGLVECVHMGTRSKRLHPGWAGLCGIVAAELADIGYDGPSTIFEGRLGLYNSFLRSGPIDLSPLLKNFGRDWEILNIRPKLYPCCHDLQSYIDCISFLQKKNNLRAGDVARIDCKVAEGAVNMVCEPWGKKISPVNSYEARFSLPFVIALMLTRGKAGPNEFSEEGLEDPEIKALMGKVSYDVEPSFKVKNLPGWVMLTLRNGERLAYGIDAVRGDASHPFSREELLEKFRMNTASLAQEKRERISEMIFHFEKIRVCELMEELSKNLY